MQITTEKLEFYESMEKAFDQLQKDNETLDTKFSSLNDELILERRGMRRFKDRIEEEVKEMLENDVDLADVLSDFCDNLGLDFPTNTVTINVEMLFGREIGGVTDSEGDLVEWDEA
jgi:hypothetical protein